MVELPQLVPWRLKHLHHRPADMAYRSRNHVHRPFLFLWRAVFVREHWIGAVIDVSMPFMASSCWSLVEVFPFNESTNGEVENGQRTLLFALQTCPTRMEAHRSDKRTANHAKERKSKADAADFLSDAERL
jgi:hypothetical protein